MTERELDDLGTSITAQTKTAINMAKPVRDATAAELAESIDAAKRDGGAGVIVVDGVSCYVTE